MTEIDPLATLTCLVCQNTQSALDAIDLGGCRVCGQANWDPALPVPKVEPTDRPDDETLSDVDSGVGERPEVPVPQPWVPTPKRRRSRKKLIWGLLALLIVGVLIQQAWSFATKQGPPAAGTSTPAPPKKGDWVLVLESLPKKSKTQADARSVASRVSKGRAVAILDTNRYTGLTKGYWAVVAGNWFKSERAARAACADFGRKPGGSCYARQLK